MLAPSTHEGDTMPFISLFLAHSPDADPERDQAVVDTGLSRVFTVVTRDQEQGLGVCRRMVAEEGVQSIVLCPGHSNADVGAIAAAVGDGVGVSVARGDARSSQIAVKAMEKAGWFAPPER